MARKAPKAPAKIETTAAAVAFFREWAGYSYDPKTETAAEGRERCARRLAEAEAWLSSQPHAIDWQEDQDADRSFLKRSDRRPLFFCVVRVPNPDGPGEWDSAALGGIDLGPTGSECPEYQRVVVAELADQLI